MQEKGSISVNTENIFPIIKKWLYSDRDIFLRELVSNGCDAISKLVQIQSKEDLESKGGELAVTVTLDEKNKTVTVSDNGIGMTAEEVKKYINQVAFSGAEEFIKKYQEETDAKNQIIGHFGLGFYSAFMVADLVTIDTLSFEEGAQPVSWSCDGGIEFEMGEGTRTQRGTTVTLHISKDAKEFLQESKLLEILYKYCGFLKYPISFTSTQKVKTKDEDGNDIEKDYEPRVINDTQPLWTKKPKDCTHEEYLEFYQKVFMDFTPPLFYIHLNVDYPFHLQGILYFPKLKNEMANIEGQIKLFNNRVYVADNIKEVIPEFLLLLKGVIDCPDLPLNVSRSFLQNDGYVEKVSAHITKKVADKLVSLYKKQPDDYKGYWDDISPFIKFGCLRDEKFYEKVKEILLLKTLDGEHITLEELKEQKPEKVYYVSDQVQQAYYINLFKEQGTKAYLLDSVIDNAFISFLEMKAPELKFARIDSDLSSDLKGEDATDEELAELFKKQISNENLKIETSNLKSEKTPAILLLSEQSRRMIEMAKQFGQEEMLGMFQEEKTLILNLSCPLIRKVKEMKNEEDQKLVINQIYDLAVLSQKPLTAEEISGFIERSNQILEKLVG